MNAHLTRGLILALSLSLTLGLAACGPSPTPVPTPKPSATPTPGPSPSPTPTPSASPTPSPVPEAASTYFVANLNGSQEVPGVSSQGQGVAKVVLAPGRSEAMIEVSVSGLSGPITGAHIHRGQPGQSGPVIKELEVKGNVMTATWRRNDSSMRLDEDTVQDLLNGGLYVNVHTAANPNGEVRGQLNLTQDQLHVVYLSSGQEVPAVSAKASGVALVRISADGSQVSLDGQGHNLGSEVTAAHLHRAAVGVAGPVVKPVNVDANNHFTLTWRRNDADSPLTDELLAALKNGELYINLHTVVNPSGELRGQLGRIPALNTTFWFSGELEPAQEVPPVDRPAYGAVEARLNAESMEVELEGYISGLSGPIKDAHIHQGAAGFNGQVVKNLTVDGNRISATWKMSDSSQPLTKGLYADLLAGNLYANVHTDAHPGGEARAQLRSTAYMTYTLGLNGAAEVPPVNTDAKATATIGLSPDHRTVVVKGVAHNLSGPIVGAHIHTGPAGLAGPVVKDLSVNGSSFTVVWKHTDQAQPLTPEMVTKLMAGELYVNLHTNANPNGEVRAQIK